MAKNSMSVSEFKKASRQSQYELAFENALRTYGRDILETVKLEREFRFNPARKSRFDFAIPELKIAIEIDGGQWVVHGGRHNRDSDREKMNAAVALGWRVIRFSGQQVMTDPIGCVEVLRVAIEPAPTRKQEKDWIKEALRSGSYNPNAKYGAEFTLGVKR